MLQSNLLTSQIDLKLKLSLLFLVVYRTSLIYIIVEHFIYNTKVDLVELAGLWWPLFDAAVTLGDVFIKA